jgi:hypothetical protein
VQPDIEKKRIKHKFWSWKDVITEMKNSINHFNNRLNHAEKRIGR